MQMTPDTERAAPAARARTTWLPDTWRLRFRLAGIAAAAYFLLILVMAFRPGWLGAGRTGPAMFTGMGASLLVILVIFAVTAVFVRHITRLSGRPPHGTDAHGQ
jgi:uncharacterized membrane protein (DUF485 family)